MITPTDIANAEVAGDGRLGQNFVLYTKFTPDSPTRQSLFFNRLNAFRTACDVINACPNTASAMVIDRSNDKSHHVTKETRARDYVFTTAERMMHIAAIRDNHPEISAGTADMIVDYFASIIADEEGAP